MGWWGPTLTNPDRPQVSPCSAAVPLAVESRCMSAWYSSARLGSRARKARSRMTEIRTCAPDSVGDSALEESRDGPVAPPMTPREVGGGVRPRYRSQLDGLRALAVYLVVAFHSGVHSLSGGFIGVDVFFVLSGYLVTGLLLRDFATRSRVDLVRFYSRRFRRLLPAAFVALIVTAVVFTAVASPSETSDAMGGFRSAFLYVANWHFISQSNDYFAQTSTAIRCSTSGRWPWRSSPTFLAATSEWRLRSRSSQRSPPMECCSRCSGGRIRGVARQRAADVAIGPEPRVLRHRYARVRVARGGVPRVDASAVQIASPPSPPRPGGRTTQRRTPDCRRDVRRARRPHYEGNRGSGRDMG